MNDDNKFEIIKFKDGNISLDVEVSVENNTVWLTQKDMALLFNVSPENIRLHIKNIIEEPDITWATIEDFSATSKESLVVQMEGNRQVTRKIKYYNLDMITAVGNRIKSKEAVIFRAWALDMVRALEYRKNALVEPIIRFEKDGVCLDVSISPEEKTLWLTQSQICELFDSSKANISEHIAHIFESGELNYNSVVRNFRTTGADGKTYNVLHYNLDMILAVGYKVNSKRGIMFRIWASEILNNYLMGGFAVNKDRCLACSTLVFRLENDVYELKQEIADVKKIVYGDEENLYYEGEILEAYSFIIKLFFLAKKEIIIVDSYADDFVLEMLKNITVPVTIYTAAYINEVNQENITIIKTNIFHDRYIIIDNMVFSSGTSLNSIGKKRFTIHKLVAVEKKMLLKNIK